MSLAGRLAGRLSGSLAGALAGSGASAPSLDDLGAALLYHWEVPASSSPLITLNAGNVSQLNDRVGSAHMIQGTAAVQPQYNSSGGPNDAPYITLQAVGRFLAATISIAAANRAGLYVVARQVAGAATRTLATTAAGGTLGHRVRHALSNQFSHVARFTGGEQVVTATTPAFDTNWHLCAIRPLASGALAQVDGVTTSPNFTGTDTMIALDTARIGDASTAAGDLASMVIVDNPTDDLDTIVRAYVASVYGLSV